MTYWRDEKTRWRDKVREITYIHIINERVDTFTKGVFMGSGEEWRKLCHKMDMLLHGYG
jgi:hypothetical protein